MSVRLSSHIQKNSQLGDLSICVFFFYCCILFTVSRFIFLLICDNSALALHQFCAVFENENFIFFHDESTRDHHHHQVESREFIYFSFVWNWNFRMCYDSTSALFIFKSLVEFSIIFFGFFLYFFACLLKFKNDDDQRVTECARSRPWARDISSEIKYLLVNLFNDTKLLSLLTENKKQKWENQNSSSF